MNHHRYSAALVFVACIILGASATRAICPVTPDVACKFAATASLSYKNNPDDDAKDAFAFKLSKGANALVGDFGDPTTTDAYDVCLYADGNLAASMAVAADGDCADKSCWVAKTKGPAFKDKTGANDGVTAIKLAAPDDGTDTTKISVKAKGTNLPDVTLPIDTPIAVQVRNALGNCWGVLLGEATQDTTKGTLKAKLKSDTFPTCSDGERNGFETDINCGGGCTGCTYDKFCDGGDDCLTGICRFGRCASKRIFVTSSTFTGSFGGIAAADAACNANGNIHMPGTAWVAWVSTSTVNAFDRILDTEYRLVNGNLAFENKAQITTLMRPYESLAVSSSGGAVSGNIWTATSNGGATIGGVNCEDWTSNSSGLDGYRGTPSNESLWSGSGVSSCSTSNRLLCFEQ